VKPNVEIVELPAMRVAAVPHHGPYNEIPPAFNTLGQIAGSAGLFTPSAAMLGIYYDDPRTTPPSQLRSAAALTVAEDTTLPPGLEERRVPAGRFARSVHLGPYDALPEAWSRLMSDAIPAAGGKRRAGASLEIYRNNPHEVPPEQLITELYVPVE